MPHCDGYDYSQFSFHQPPPLSKRRPRHTISELVISDDPNIPTNKGKVLSVVGNYQESIQLFDKALSVNAEGFRLSYATIEKSSSGASDNRSKY